MSRNHPDQWPLMSDRRQYHKNSLFKQVINSTRRSNQYINRMAQNLTEWVSSSDSVHNFVIVMLGVIILIICYAYIGNLLEYKHIHVIHETGVGIIIGFLFGLIMWAIGNATHYQFDQNIFFFGLLPPMIFAGGYNLMKKKFFQNFFYISLFGVLGTLVTFGIIFGFTYLINQLGFIRRWTDFNSPVTLSLALIMKYSATICASDSVAALTMIKPAKYPKLFSIVFGEGMVNDAVAIILFKVVGDIFGNNDQEAVGVILANIVWRFIVNVLGSLAIGIACSLVCSKIFQKSRFLTHSPIVEVTVMYMFGILSYVIAEISHMSGVITVLVCGITLAHFNFYNLSITAQISTGVTFQTISFVAQAFVFIYLGISTMTYVSTSKFSYTFVLLELVICAFARFATIFMLSYFFKIFKKKTWKVSFWELLVVSFAGVIRGSVAFALILTLGGTTPSEEIQIIQSSVMLMVFITTIFLGALMPTIIKCCLKRDQKNQEVSLLEQLGENAEIQKPKKPLTGFKKFDELFLKPFFIHDYENRKQQIKDFKRLLKLNSPEYKGGEFTGIMRANARQTLAMDLQEEYEKKSYEKKSIKSSERSRKSEEKQKKSEENINILH